VLALLLGQTKCCLAVGTGFIHVGLSVSELGFFTGKEGFDLALNSKIFIVFLPALIHVFGKHTENRVAQQSVINYRKAKLYPRVENENRNYGHRKSRPHAKAEKVIRTVAPDHKRIEFLC